MLRLSPCSNRFLSYVKKVLHKSQMNAQQVLNAAFIQAAESPATVSSTAIVPYTGSSSSGYNHRVRAQLADGGFNGALVPSSRKRELPGTALVPSSQIEEGGYYANLGGSYGLQFGVPGAAAGYLAGHALDSVGGLSGIGKKMKSFFGFGDYSLKSNSLIGGGRGAGRGGQVQIVSSGPRSTRIIYREYIGDVYSHPYEPNSFHVVSYPLNPGLSSTFKWLPPIATQFEQWSPNGIVFEFRSTSSEYVSQQALGSIIMATEYDSYDKPYSSKVEMLNSAYANEGKPSDHLLHGIECDPRDNPNSIFYVRDSALDEGDIRDYDLGVFYVATQGIPHANANLGSLYVHYDITFRKEQLHGGLLLRNQLWFHLYATDVSVNFPFGSEIKDRQSNGLDIGIVAGNIVFPRYTEGMCFLVLRRLVLPASSATSYSGYFSVGTGCEIIGSTGQVDAVGDENLFAFTHYVVIRQTSPVCTLTDESAIPSGSNPSDSTLNIMQVSQEYVNFLGFRPPF